MSFYRHMIASPVGDLTLAANDSGLTMLGWSPVAGGTETPDHPVLLAATHQLAEYFAGTRHAFDLPLAPDGTPFQQAVWRALLDIPYGETRSYADVARSIGRPSATRAVGAANGRNPLAIVMPCHRVIGASGGLTGFAGGMTAKRLLLDLERADRLLF
jgi:methylated-DNA-[protein]-cysteine S-methyltransferase